MSILKSFLQGVDQARRSVKGPSLEEMKAKLIDRVRKAKTREELEQIQKEIAEATKLVG